MKGFKAGFYYVRDDEGKPIITVCLGTDGTDISRGIALCNMEMDIPKKSEGRKYAFDRAYNALVLKRDIYGINKTGERVPVQRNIYKMAIECMTPLETVYVSYANNRGELFRGQYNPELCRFSLDIENKIIQKKFKLTKCFVVQPEERFKRITARLAERIR